MQRRFTRIIAFLGVGLALVVAATQVYAERRPTRRPAGVRPAAFRPPPVRADSARLKIDPRLLSAAEAFGVGTPAASAAAGAGVGRLLSWYQDPAARIPAPEPGKARIAEDGSVQVYLTVAAAAGANLAGVASPQPSAVDQMLAASFGIGLKVEHIDPEQGRVQAWVAIDRIADLAGLDEVAALGVPDYAVTRVGSALSAGDAILLAADLRSQQGLDGSGVTVGVISDSASLASLNGAFAAGDLPHSSQIMIGANPPGTDEGTAILEIVHDLAPGANLAFYGAVTDLDMENGIEWLTTQAGCDVIIDDLGFFLQPYFEDGPIARKVSEVVTRGVSYHSAAGNEAREHYLSAFASPGLGPGERHQFAAGDDTMRIRIGVGDTAFVVLQWAEPFGSASTNYDLVVLGSDLTTELGASRTIQNGDGDPIEVVAVTNNGGGSLSAEVTIERTAGSFPDLRMFVLGAVVEEHAVLQGSIFGHPAAEGVVAVGAVNASDPGNDSIEFFSSRGPSRIDFPSVQSRDKPELVAVDGVAVSGQSGFPSTFFGTSAAAPHTAAIAALLIEGLGAGPGQIKQCLQAGAVDLGAAGFDFVFGAGRADALSSFEGCVGIPCGDADGDGGRNASDALIALRTAVGATQCELCRCDIDGNGAVSASDAQRLLRIGVGQNVPLMCPAC